MPPPIDGTQATGDIAQKRQPSWLERIARGGLAGVAASGPRAPLARPYYDIGSALGKAGRAVYDSQHKKPVPPQPTGVGASAKAFQAVGPNSQKLPDMGFEDYMGVGGPQDTGTALTVRPAPTGPRGGGSTPIIPTTPSDPATTAGGIPDTGMSYGGSGYPSIQTYYGQPSTSGGSGTSVSSGVLGYGPGFGGTSPYQPYGGNAGVGGDGLPVKTYFGDPNLLNWGSGWQTGGNNSDDTELAYSSGAVLRGKPNAQGGTAYGPTHAMIGGTPAFIGEGGQPEYVVPLDKTQEFAQLTLSQGQPPDPADIPAPANVRGMMDNPPPPLNAPPMESKPSPPSNPTPPSLGTPGGPPTLRPPASPSPNSTDIANPMGLDYRTTPTVQPQHQQQAAQIQIPPPLGAAKSPSILRRIAAMGIGAAAGVSNARGGAPHIDTSGITQEILYPGRARAVQQRQQQVQAAKEQAALDAQIEGTAGLKEQREATAEQRRAQAANYGTVQQEKTDKIKADADAKEAARNQRLYELFIKGNEGSVVPLHRGETAPPGWQVIDHPDGGQVAIPPAMVALPGQLVPYAPGHNPGDMIDRGTYNKALGHYQDELKARNVAGAKPDKPPTAEENKLAFQKIVGKVAAEQGLPDAALTDVRLMSQAIQKSKTTTPDERNFARAYLGTNTTPSATGAAATIRVEGLGQMRENPVIDTHNGNSLAYVSSADLNKANHETPGRYIPTGPGGQALNRTALIEDIRGSIGQVRNSLTAIPEFTAGDKATIAVALRDRDPRSAISQLIGGVAGGRMTPDQQEYLINLAQLHEQAMAMRSVLGAGQGSEDLRAAILRTIPGPSTPNKAYAAKQLDQFEATLNRLSRGVPNVPLRTEGGRGGATPKGAVPYSDSGVDYNIPAAQVAEFLKDHPAAVKK